MLVENNRRNLLVPAFLANRAGNRIIFLIRTRCNPFRKIGINGFISEIDICHRKIMRIGNFPQLMPHREANNVILRQFITFIEVLIYQIILLRISQELNLRELLSEFNSLEEVVIIDELTCVVPSEQRKRTMLNKELNLFPEIFRIGIIQTKVTIIGSKDNGELLVPSCN